MALFGLSESLDLIATSLTLEAKVLDNYSDRLNFTVKKAYKHIAISMALFGLSESLDLIAMALAFWYGGRLLSEREYDAQTFFVVFTAIIFGGQAAGFLFGFTMNTTKAHAAANQILHLRAQQPPINSSTDTTKAHAAANQILHLRAQQPPINSSTGAAPNPDSGETAIEFSNVRFSYPTRPDLPILRGLNMKIHQGQFVGIVGASGCGKTTVISLLERFYDIKSGDIRIHGQRLIDLDVHAHRATTGLVSQDTTLYQGSIKDNVLLGTSTEDESKLIQACKDANIHDFIMSLPEGYDTDSGSRGLALSGGQRQRIAVARALIRDPKLLLLDEATSALDTESEEVVQRALETAAKGRTTVAVAHRLSTIRDADRIFVLDRGVVVEEGTHDELAKMKGRYWEMVQAQSLDRVAK
ncbi:hypothetical protein V498_08451 [Pseudogymnoascus sp. VKM F-4517 (FW-2822)]|nr:hypothetical protein V498_08451 [Pseudogymnoascus sp. VKM F-4517 (FW-2822)]